MLFQSQPSGLEIHICSFSDRRWILLASNAGLHCFSECHCLLGCVRDTVLFYRLSKTKWHYQTNSLWLWTLCALCSPTAENHFICHHLLPTLSPPHMAQGMGIIIALILSWLLTTPQGPLTWWLWWSHFLERTRPWLGSCSSSMSAIWWVLGPC